MATSMIPNMKARFADPNAGRSSPTGIGTPIKLETAAMPVIIEAPPPKMAKHLQMQLPEEKLALVRRVVDADLEELIPATLPLFANRFPRMEDDSFASYVRSNLHNNMCRVVRTDNAWGIAAVERTFWEPRGWVEVIGVAKLRSSTMDPLAIYLDFMKWARDIKAAEFRMPQLSNYNLEPFAKRLGLTDKCVQYFGILE